MYKVDFSLNQFNFRVTFNNKEDYILYDNVIRNSIIDMKHKMNNKTLITIHYINDNSIYNEMFKNLNYDKKETISSFENEYYDKYNDIFVSSKNRYLIKNINNANFNIVCKENLKRPELIYIIREIYVRLQENKNALFLHANGININNKGLMLCGNSGSGKTTFMLKLFEAEKNEFNYLSNDRIFLKPDNKIEYFPIPIILANGTARNIAPIYNYLLNKEHLYDSEYTKEILLNGKDTDKYALFKRYIKEIFPNCNLKEQTALNGIIIPKINFNTKDIQIEEIRDYKKLLPICFTPTDRESLRKPWILKRIYNDEELLNKSEYILKETVNKNAFFTVEYNPNLDSQILNKKIKTKILERI